MYGQSWGYKPGKWDTFDLNTNFTVFFRVGGWKFSQNIPYLVYS